MTQLEEDSLTEWIISIDSRGFAPKRHTIRDMANLLLAKRGNTVYQQIGHNWVDRYIAYTPTVVSRLSRRYGYKRVECEDPKEIQKWFNTVQHTIIEHGITDDDIWNFDETGFAMGLTGRSYIVSSSEFKESQQKVTIPSNRE